MGKVRIRSLDRLEPASLALTGETASAGVVSGELFGGPDSPIHARLHKLPRGATLAFGKTASGYLGYVWQGEITLGDEVLKAGSVVVIEHQASNEIRASAENTQLLVFNTAAAHSAPSRAGGHVHLLPHERVPRLKRVSDEINVSLAIYADSACPTCEMWLHGNFFHEPDKEVELHYHSEDEIIVVTDGKIVLGQRTYGPGTAIAVAKDTVYGFRTGPEGLGFINFRPTHPTYSSRDGSNFIDEQVMYNRYLGRPPYLEV